MKNYESGCYGAGLAEKINGPQTPPLGREELELDNKQSLSPSQKTSWSEPMYCHGCRNWGVLFPMVTPAG